MVKGHSLETRLDGSRAHTLEDLGDENGGIMWRRDEGKDEEKRGGKGWGRGEGGWKGER